MLQNAIDNFIRKYDEAAIKSIEVMSKDRSLNYPKYSFESFDIDASVKLFREWMQFYTQYKCKNNNSNNTESIMEKCKQFIGNQKINESDPYLFESCKVKYTDGASVVKCYIESIQSIISDIDNMTTQLYEAGVDNDSIGALSEMGDLFSDALTERFDEAMNHFLKVSGYQHSVWQSQLGKEIKEQKPAIVFA